MKRFTPIRCLPFLVAALASAGASADARASTPERVRTLEATLWDQPVAAERQAQADLARAEAAGDAARRYEAALRLAVAAGALEHTVVAQRAAAIVQAEVDARDDAQARCLLADLPPQTDDVHASRYLGQLVRQLESARRDGARWCVARLQATRGTVLDRVGRLDEGIEALQEALDLFEAEGDTASAASVRSSLAWLYARLDDTPSALQKAIDHGLAAVAAAERLKLRALASIARHNVAGPLLRASRTDEAQEHLLRAIALSHEIGDKLGSAYNARLQARVEEARGHPAAGLALFRWAQAVFTDYQDPGMELVCRVGAMEMLAMLGRWSELESDLAATEPLLQQVQDREMEVTMRRLAMQLKEARGDLGGALAAAKAWSETQDRYFREQNRRAAVEARERHESARQEADNKRLRDLQDAAQSRQALLLVTLGLALALVALLLLHGVRQRRLRALLRERAERDDLTQLPNRRAMLDHAQCSLDEATRLDRPMAVALLDIDHFKSVNDRYGHEVGDEALRTFADVCARTLRRQDRLGRIGGEEFLGVFPGASAEDLEAIFERIRAALRETPVPGMAPDERLSFSMGVAFRQHADEMSAITRRADQALYDAKAQGRDRLALAA